MADSLPNPLVRPLDASALAIRTGLDPDEARLVRMLRALSNPVRLEIVRWLASNPNCITGDVVQVAGLAQSTVSRHLAVLRDAGLVCGTIDGPATCYCVDGEALAWLGRQVGAWVDHVNAMCAACACDDAVGRCDC